MLLRALLIALFILMARTGVAHEVRPAYLQITERPDHRYDILWKQPAMGAQGIRLVPHISGGLLEVPPSNVEATASYQIIVWRAVDAGAQGLQERTLEIEGLDRTITDALVAISRSDGSSNQHILRPQDPRLMLELQSPTGASVPEFILHGVQHILTGTDHLLFVLALMLIVGGGRRLIITVSAFTLAHSLTLAAATFAKIDLSTPLLNALIALSILFVAVEVIRAARGGTSVTIRYPWLVAFVFGLLHGLGFATGLSPLGLQKGALILALLSFNLGVEIGQLLFIVVVLTLVRALRNMPFTWTSRLVDTPAYAIGVMGAFWTFEYGAMLFGSL